MEEQLKNRVAVVTGGSSGIGRASALAFNERGARVVVADVDVKGGEETIRMIKETGGEGLFVGTDVSKWAEVEAMVHKTVQAYGRLDYAFNNAGVTQNIYAPTAECTEEDWDRIMNTNLKGVWLCMKYEIPQMLKQGGGAIVNNSSFTGLVGYQRRPAYSVSKHGVIGLTRTAALEYAEAGIRINAVCPGYIRTPMVESAIKKDLGVEERATKMTPLGRMGRAEEIAEAVVWLCSDSASFVIGHPLVVDGGVVSQ